jgi:FkbM family methyltransferase
MRAPRAVRRSIRHLTELKLIHVPRLGYDLDSHLQKLLPLLRVNAVVDVGANDGSTAAGLRGLGYRGAIFSFEPGPAGDRLTTRAAADPDWSVFRYAIGAADGETTLNVTARDVFSSIHEPTDLARSDFAEETAVLERRTVPIRRLDSLFFDEVGSDIHDPRVFLKSDTQGFDLEVIASAEGIRDRIVAVQIETATRNLYEDAPDCVATLQTMMDHGFRLIRTYPTTDWHVLNDYDQDWIFIRDNDDPAG